MALGIYGPTKLWPFIVMALYNYGPRYLRPYKVMARTYTDAVHEGGVRMNVCTDMWPDGMRLFMGLLCSYGPI